MSGPRRFLLPKGRRPPPRWVVVSLVVHLLVAAAIVSTHGWQPAAPERTLSYLLNIATPPPTPREVKLEAPVPPPPARRGRSLVFRAAPALPADTASPPPPLGDEPAGVPSGTPGGRGQAGRLLALTPHTGDPRLWVRPMIIPEGGGRPITLDSAVRTRLLAMADSLERHPASDPNRPPSWTFQRDGKTYGLDAQGMHFGSFTIPTMVLALLPMPQGNIDQSRANAALMLLRADMLRAAARAEAEDDFRRAVRDIRERKDRERREQRERDQRERDRPIP